jgi:hypothetical protein
MTLETLLAAWEYRDRLYTRRKSLGVFSPLTADEVDAIRTMRRMEALELPKGDRTRALTIVALWEAPEREMAA